MKERWTGTHTNEWMDDTDWVNLRNYTVNVAPEKKLRSVVKRVYLQIVLFRTIYYYQVAVIFQTTIHAYC
jgi:hypothetical protein